MKFYIKELALLFDITCLFLLLIKLAGKDIAQFTSTYKYTTLIYIIE